MLSVELVRGGKVDSVVRLGDFQGPFPQSRGLFKAGRTRVPYPLIRRKWLVYTFSYCLL